MKKAYASPKVASKGDLRSVTLGDWGRGSYDTFQFWGEEHDNPFLS